MITKELLILPEHLSSTPVFSGVRVTRSFVLWVVFCSSLFLLSFFFWPLCCLSFFDLQIIITPLVSSSISSCNKRNTTGATSGAVTTYSSGAHEVTPCCSIFSCPCSGFVDHYNFSFGHCFVNLSIYGFWLSLWYLQTFLVIRDQIRDFLK